jgi:glycosyltransferase involved in cell wall biosynthesis
MSRKLLWIGDACVSSGFAKATHNILDHLRHTWDVHVLGINYLGDPHDKPYPVYPCYPGGDFFGIGRTKELVGKLRPDIVVVLNDPWNVPEYMKRAEGTPVAAMVAVDGKNCRGRGMNGLATAMFWTEFGMKEAQSGGYTGPACVIPLGVDTDIYQTGDKVAARNALGLPPRLRDAFIVGNVNRNQPRKRLDLCISYFAEWVRTYEVPDAFFYFHTAPTGDQGYDCRQLAAYYGISTRLIIAEPDIGHGVLESDLVTTYQAFDAMLTTTQGEGFGLGTFEGMACGIPQIVPDWSALGELCEDAALKVECTEIACTPNKINVIGGIADRAGTIQALRTLYEDPIQYSLYRNRGLKLMENPRFRWENIAKSVDEALTEALKAKV